ncbi:YwiC-like family protein [Nigerium massiliense]|uniref:YwiC-like family protein n=1 Tax=Nigerium massiliense TaxID=1522317 RepID=UPI0011CABEDD|nr:YwiC-like family protein [Nigerium massiliense]
MSSRRRPQAKKAGWIPQQHGAWAMLFVPYVAGSLLCVRHGTAIPTYAWVLLFFWLAGYFCFNAASLWLKAPSSRRGPLQRPLLVYAAAAAVLGLGTLALAGWPILGWVPAYLVALVPAMVLASRRHERATLGGALTTAGASLMTAVVVYRSPADLAAASGTPLGAAVLATTCFCFAYFFGTVLYVKTNIRERDSVGYLAASIGWHAAATVAAALAAGLAGTSWWWAVFFAAATVRAAVVPRVRPRWSPRRLGLVEGVACLALLVVVGLG